MLSILIPCQLWLLNVFTGMLMNPLMKRLGTRRVAATGGLMSGICILTTAFTQSVYLTGFLFVSAGNHLSFSHVFLHLLRLIILFLINYIHFILLLPLLSSPPPFFPSSSYFCSLSSLFFILLSSSYSFSLSSSSSFNISSSFFVLALPFYASVTK